MGEVGQLSFKFQTWTKVVSESLLMMDGLPRSRFTHTSPILERTVSWEQVIFICFAMFPTFGQSHLSNHIVIGWLQLAGTSESE